MSDKIIKKIHRQLQSAGRILILSHLRPDGDAVGSLLGLGLALEEVGKKVQMVLNDGVPAAFHHLEGSERVVKRPEGQFDLIITLDCSDMQRVGDVLSGYKLPDINIDHHITNLGYAALNLVEPEAVATAEILARYFDEFGLPLIKPVAEALLTGIITDTIGFRTSNMTPVALRVAAELMDAGVDLPGLYNQALSKRSFEAARLWGVGLSKLQREGPIVWTTLTLADRRSIGYPGLDDADLINVIASINGAEVAVLFVEYSSSLVKVSWRAQPQYDVSQLALSYGGGGHPAAAGAEIKGTVAEVKELVLNDIRTYLKENVPGLKN
jgi:bifunctional oligoribonuclease and PAP phosphatase NrnA